ncbi:hypothetical protein TNCT_211001 [Trichonephila clavata]|uniref:Uncharacterized protein n=1 Tax=Trichonephila clavata TaxID=2740835 RepID=A0A8X6LI14_TRICU|nr:hypothetical protein TNCT_211001 [Trichonephila clavata]
MKDPQPMPTIKFNTASQCRTLLYPCRDADPKKETRGGAYVSKTVYLILELCCMAGTTDCTRADSMMMREMSNRTQTHHLSARGRKTSKKNSHWNFSKKHLHSYFQFQSTIGNEVNKENYDLKKKQKPSSPTPLRAQRLNMRRCATIANDNTPRNEIQNYL